MKCIIIDDEQHAIEVLQHYIGKYPNLELAGSFTNPIEGLKVIKKEKVELVFLDIQMDEMTGLEVASILNENIKIIFCTAFSEYALDGFDANAIDYLLKPISFERFSKAIDKVSKFISIKDYENTPDYILVKTEQKGKLIKINFNEIDYVESVGNYVTFHCSERNITAYATLRDLESYLPTQQFIRVHKSHIINSTRISAIENGFVQIKTNTSTQKLSIGNTYKDLLMKHLKPFSP